MGTFVGGVIVFFIGRGTADITDTASNKESLSQVKNIQSANVRVSGHEIDNLPKLNRRGYELAQSPRAGLAVLVGELERSPLAEMNFEALFGIWDMLQYVDVSEFPLLLNELSDNNAGQMVRMMLLNRWGSVDGPMAIEAILAGSERGINPLGAVGAVTGWMISDPEEAYAWFSAHGAELGTERVGLGQDEIEVMYLTSLAKFDLRGTMRKLDGLSSEMQRDIISSLTEAVASDLEKREELFSFLSERRDPSLLREARQNIVDHLTWANPQETIHFIDSEEIEAGEKRELEVRFATDWASSDPEEAMAFLVDRLDEQENIGDGVAAVFGHWIGDDEVAASEWLRNQPDKYRTDEVFQQAGFHLTLAGEHERAMAWVDQLLNERQRQVGRGQIYQAWSRVDKDAAAEWRATLPDEIAITLPNLPRE